MSNHDLSLNKLAVAGATLLPSDHVPKKSQVERPPYNRRVEVGLGAGRDAEHLADGGSRCPAGCDLVLAADFPRIPPLRYKHALGLLLVSSLFLYVVLTMISGARELMTPGAWVKNGATYQLATPDRDPKPWLESARLSALENLRDALWKYAREHDGELPAHREVPDIPAVLWKGIHPEGDPLAYVPGAEAGKGSRVVAYEPESFGPRRAVLMSDGSVTIISAYELQKRVVATLQSKTP